MEELKNIIAKSVVKALDGSVTEQDIISKIEVPKDKVNGDFAYPCFNLAKVLRNSPINIANEIKEKIALNDKISKVEVVNGYLNFYINSMSISSDVLSKILIENEKFGSSNEGDGKNIVIDYSSPNIAKPFHLGHLRNTVIGQTLYNTYKELGYNVIGVNHLGDWGRQFGLLIEGYTRFKDEYDIEKDPIAVLSDIYVRINRLAKEDENIMNVARENFKKLEEGDAEYTKTWEYFKEISLKEYSRIYDILGCKFDSYNGEAFYNDKMDEVVEILDEKGVLVESEGAKVVNLGENEPPCIILKSNGSTIYATRDLAAILYRARTYNFDKAIYVTAYEQIHHFKQVFEVAKYLVDSKYSNNLIHVAYGMVRLKTGKMSTREGNVIYTQNLIDDAVLKAQNIIKEKNSEIENVEKVANQVGVGALIFNNIKQNKIKDIVFDLDEVLRFDGETGPYVQYTYVRTQSILKKSNLNIEDIKLGEINFELLKENVEIELIKSLDLIGEVIKRVADNYEPSILTRYLIDIATLFSKFYNDCTVLTENEDLTKARCSLVYCTGIVLKKGLTILGIECPEKM